MSETRLTVNLEHKNLSWFTVNALASKTIPWGMKTILRSKEPKIIRATLQERIEEWAVDIPGWEWDDELGCYPISFEQVVTKKRRKRTAQIQAVNPYCNRPYIVDDVSREVLDTMREMLE